LTAQWRDIINTGIRCLSRTRRFPKRTGQVIKTSAEVIPLGKVKMPVASQVVDQDNALKTREITR
jgi:hypothetical protein